MTPGSHLAPGDGDGKRNGVSSLSKIWKAIELDGLPYMDTDIVSNDCTC